MSCCGASVDGQGIVSYTTRAEQAEAHARLILEDAGSDEVRRLARQIAADLGADPMGYSAAEHAAVWRYLRDRVRYVAEHNEVWTPTMRLLADGAGDCDDMATAAAALLAALGHRVALAYGSGHMWIVAESPDGDVSHVDPTLERAPWRGPAVDVEELYVLTTTGVDPHATGAPPAANAAQCPTTPEAAIKVPRDELYACLIAATKEAGETWTWPQYGTAAALEIGRRCVEGHGSAGGIDDFMDPANMWLTLFVGAHGCDAIRHLNLAFNFLQLKDAQDIVKTIADVANCDLPESEPPTTASEAWEEQWQAAVHDAAGALGLKTDADGNWRTADGRAVYWTTDKIPPTPAVWIAGEGMVGPRPLGATVPFAVWLAEGNAAEQAALERGEAAADDIVRGTPPTTATPGERAAVALGGAGLLLLALRLLA